MIRARCPVCTQPLEPVAGVWRCENGHDFDVARQGYVNLLTVEQKHSKNPGDTRAQVAARKEFLDEGHYSSIADTVCEILAGDRPTSVLDAGCGEGYYLTQLQHHLPDADCWGLDISKEAVRYAAARNKKARWLVGTAVRLPFADESFDCVISMFALTAPAEFARVLKPGGIFLQVLAGEEHLMALKRLIYPEILRREKVLHPALEGFVLEESRTLEFPVLLQENRQVQNLFAMTPHFFRITKDGAANIAAAETLDDTAQVVLNRFRVMR